MIEEQVKSFYGKLRFPGTYTRNDLEYFDFYESNRFLKPYIDAARISKNVLDIGCGTGFITNLLARKFIHLDIDALDFCDSIEVGKDFSYINQIKNVTWYKENFFDFISDKQYDLVISNGVIHHMPEYDKAIDKIRAYGAKQLVIGIYNKYGKLFKKISPVNYRSNMLYQDQELVPFEISFSHEEFIRKFPDYDLVSPTRLVDFKNLFNYNNGGLTIYTFSRHV